MKANVAAKTLLKREIVLFAVIGPLIKPRLTARVFSGSSITHWLFHHPWSGLGFDEVTGGKGSSVSASDSGAASLQPHSFPSRPHPLLLALLVSLCIGQVHSSHCSSRHRTGGHRHNHPATDATFGSKPKGLLCAFMPFMCKHLRD